MGNTKNKTLIVEYVDGRVETHVLGPLSRIWAVARRASLLAEVARVTSWRGTYVAGRRI